MRSQARSYCCLRQSLLQGKSVLDPANQRRNHLRSLYLHQPCCKPRRNLQHLQAPRHQPCRSQLRRPIARSFLGNVRASDPNDADVPVLCGSNHMALYHERRSMSILRRRAQPLGACVLAVIEVRRQAASGSGLDNVFCIQITSLCLMPQRFWITRNTLSSTVLRLFCAKIRRREETLSKG